jgi:hypothetical protein
MLFLLVKVKELKLRNLLKRLKEQDHGSVYKTAICLLLGCPNSKRFKRLKMET